MCWNGLKQDFKKAFDEFVKIEKDTNGYHCAQYLIGECYDVGNGTEQDSTTAFEWYTKSTDQGNSIAINNLGYCYDKGLGVAQNIKKGFELYEQSALLGSSTGMYSVGICYEEGRGQALAKDVNNAKKWYTKALAQGNMRVQSHLDLLNAA